MAGTVTRRCDNPACRRPVMVADRDGTVGNAFGSVVITDPSAVPTATCALCHHETSWSRAVVAVASSSSGWPLADAHIRNLPICAEIGHDPLATAPVPPGAVAQRICARCGGVYAEGSTG